nr:aryl-sulfate sulfotransferase [Bacteroidota bacterium]
MNLSSYHLFNNNGSPGSTTATVKCGVIQEQDANKNVVFEWHAKNHYTFLDVDTDRLFNPANVDWNHMNALELDTDGNILVSVRHFNEITKINRSTGAIMWRMGGNANQFTFTNDSVMFKGQHDIRRLANGNIIMLDNGLKSVPIHPAAAKEYMIDEVNHTATLVWSKTNSANFYSKAIGNVHRNLNGNTLVNYGMVDNFNTAFEVVKPNGTKVFELSFLDSMKSYRVYNYNSIPWDLHRPVINCVLVNNQYYLDAGNGYNSYKWTNGATTQTILATSLGSYSVFVPKGNGGFISSEKFVITNLLDPCGTLSASENGNQNTSISIYPNPVVDKIYINGLQQILHYEVRNIQGVIIWEGKDIEQQNFSFLSSGMYF